MNRVYAMGMENIGGWSRSIGGVGWWWEGYVEITQFQ